MAQSKPRLSNAYLCWKTDELLKDMQIGSYDIIGKNTQSEDSLPAPISQDLKKSFQKPTQIQKITF